MTVPTLIVAWWQENGVAAVGNSAQDTTRDLAMNDARNICMSRGGGNCQPYDAVADGCIAMAATPGAYGPNNLPYGVGTGATVQVARSAALSQLANGQIVAEGCAAGYNGTPVIGPVQTNPPGTTTASPPVHGGNPGRLQQP